MATPGSSFNPTPLGHEDNLGKFVMVIGRTEFAVGDIEKLFDEARRNTKPKHEIGRNIIINGDEMFEFRSQHIDRVRLYYQRKSDENEIRAGSSDSNVSRYKSNSFEGVRSRSNESQYSWNNGSDERREIKEKETGLKDNEDEGAYEYYRKKGQREETAIPGTSRYNLRPKRGKKMESRPSSEKRTHQRRPVRSTGRREQQYSPYSVEQGRSCGLSARSRRAQQPQRQERSGGSNSR
ncbi:uncharacterized protein TNCV_677761 [Trichonephila clavipes]|nr:uncharacterized protein TNCV_677761 [Trichonephila clavipes]